MSDSEHPSQLPARDLDVSARPWWHSLRPSSTWWVWLLVFLPALIVFGMFRDPDWLGLLAVVGVIAVLAIGASIAWMLIVRRGVFTWMRLAVGPAGAMARGDPIEAERLLTKALLRARRFAPHDHRRGLMLGVLAGYVKYQGRYPEAKELFEESLEILAQHRHADPRDYVIALNNFAIYFIHVRDHLAAQAMLEKVLDLTLTRVNVPNITFVLHLNLVFLFVEMGELTEAGHQMDEANALFADFSPRMQGKFANHYRGVRAFLTCARGQFDDAARELARAPDPNYPACLRMRARLHVIHQEFGEAERMLRQYLDGERKHGTLHRPELRDHTLNLAESLFGQGKHDEAFAALQEARAIVADFALPPDAAWRQALEQWSQRATELQRVSEAASLTADLRKLPAAWSQAITISDRLRVRRLGDG